jgi:hypothetical protein
LAIQNTHQAMKHSIFKRGLRRKAVAAPPTPEPVPPIPVHPVTITISEAGPVGVHFAKGLGSGGPRISKVDTDGIAERYHPGTITPGMHLLAVGRSEEQLTPTAGMPLPEVAQLIRVVGRPLTLCLVQASVEPEPVVGPETAVNPGRVSSSTDAQSVGLESAIGAVRSDTVKPAAQLELLAGAAPAPLADHAVAGRGQEEEAKMLWATLDKAETFPTSGPGPEPEPEPEPGPLPWGVEVVASPFKNLNGLTGRAIEFEATRDRSAASPLALSCHQRGAEIAATIADATIADATVAPDSIATVWV